MKTSIYLITQRVIVEHRDDASRAYVDELAELWGSLSGEVVGVGDEGAYEVRPDGDVTAKLIAAPDCQCGSTSRAKCVCSIAPVSSEQYLKCSRPNCVCEGGPCRAAEANAWRVRG
jgi:hypothetical protein